MENIYFFDCNVSIGSTASVRAGSFSCADDLVLNMQKHSIKKALVYHTLSRAYHPVVGNSTLIDEIAKYEQLYPVWAVMPNHTGEFYSVKELEEKMQSNSVKAVRLFPNEHNFSISAWCCGELWSFLAAKKVPVMFEVNSISFNELYLLGKEYPNLRIILINTGYNADRNLYPIMEQLPNIYIQSAGYRVCNGIENLCSRFGAERIIFGSGMPSDSAASAVTMIYYANISLDDKMKIAHGNITRLLEEADL